MKSRRGKYYLLEFMKENGRGLIVGPPGSGKTRLSSWCACKLAEKRRIIYAEPLRKLRDYVAIYFREEGVEPFILKAHDEICTSLADRLRQGEDYLHALKAHLDEDNCSYTTHFEDLKEYINDGGRVIVTTHKLGLFAWLMLHKRHKKITLVFDEGEDFILKASEPFTYDYLETVKRLDIRIYRRIKSSLREYKNFWFLKPSLLSKSVFFSFVISATFPKVLKEILVDGFESPVYRLHGKKSKDMIAYYTKPLHWKHKKKWITLIERLLDVILERATPVGITVRNTQVGVELKKWALRSGWRISYDAEHLHVDPLADLWILVVGGKFCRGVSFRPEKGKDDKGRYDFHVALGTYQRGTTLVLDDQIPFPVENIVHPLIFALFPSDEAYFDYINELRHAVNVQALFRFNRYRDRKHIMFIVDSRLWSAIRHFLPYYSDTSQKIKVKELSDMIRVARRIL